MRKRGKPLLDNIDLKILEVIKNKEYAIMQLRDKMDLRHKNLKAHLDKLHKGELILKTPTFKSRKIVLSLPKHRSIDTIIKTLKNLNK